jgi:hypothetical protein
MIMGTVRLLSSIVTSQSFRDGASERRAGSRDLKLAKRELYFRFGAKGFCVGKLDARAEPRTKASVRLRVVGVRRLYRELQAWEDGASNDHSAVGSLNRRHLVVPGKSDLIAPNLLVRA